MRWTCRTKPNLFHSLRPTAKPFNAQLSIFTCTKQCFIVGKSSEAWANARCNIFYTILVLGKISVLHWMHMVFHGNSKWFFHKIFIHFVLTTFMVPFIQQFMLSVDRVWYRIAIHSCKLKLKAIFDEGTCTFTEHANHLIWFSIQKGYCYTCNMF